MADTIADVLIPTGSYVDIYTATGIIVGTSIVIQNKSLQPIWVQEGAAQPSGTSFDGVVVERFKSVIVTAGATGVWVKGEGKISVQEYA